MAELRKALFLLKDHKAAGCDRITAEYLDHIPQSSGPRTLPHDVKIRAWIFGPKTLPHRH